ncbi:hypothetical protein NDU88_002951 [Pleurodeles waltl]|uniref:Uncharacterized protein n=1 Tax=Pleurodeles waltl TaxID=8319 RepID=A0AAV7RG20_PLEWA|nr:hypothetical protein NDU88_002951 [Pleurodeles waltl]
MWWNEAPYDDREEASRIPRERPSKRQKRIQRHQYAEKTFELTKKNPGATGKVYTVARDFRQSQRDDPSLKNTWQQALRHEDNGELKGRGPGDRKEVKDRGGNGPGGVRRRATEAREDTAAKRNRQSIEDPRGRRPSRTENQHGPNLGRRPPAPGSNSLGPATLQEKRGQARYGAGNG